MADAFCSSGTSPTGPSPETRTFNLWWLNDRGLYEAALDFAESRCHEDDYRLGEEVVDYVLTLARESATSADLSIAGRAFWIGLLVEIGSWWRIDKAAVGESVRESLAAEGGAA